MKSFYLFMGLALCGAGPLEYAQGEGGGAGTRGGGDAIRCLQKVSGIEIKRTHLADTFQLKIRQRIKDLTVFNQMREKDIGKALWESLKKKDPKKYKMIRDHFEKIKFEYVSTVPEMDDDDIVDLPEGCEKVQLAVQYFPNQHPRRHIVQIADPV